MAITPLVLVIWPSEAIYMGKDAVIALVVSRKAELSGYTDVYED
jgi:hypothetical protein